MLSLLPPGVIVIGHWHTHGGKYFSSGKDGNEDWRTAEELYPHQLKELHKFSDGDRGIMRDLFDQMQGGDFYGVRRRLAGKEQNWVLASDGRWFQVDPDFEMYLGMQNGEMMRMDQTRRGRKL